MKANGLYHAVLYVRDIQVSRAFYRDLLGFIELGAELPNQRVAAFIGSDHRTHHELLLIEVGDATEAPKGRRLGLYHLGVKVGNSKAELRAAYDELVAAGVPVDGSSDHTATWSLYIRDPDGNEIEVYCDNPDIDWKANPDAAMAPVRPLTWDGA